MESLIETLLTFVPIALIIALRIAASKRNQQQLQERSRIVDVLKTKAVKVTAKTAAAPQGYKSAFVFEESAHPPIANWEKSASTKPIAVSTPIETTIMEKASMIETAAAEAYDTARPVREKISKKEAHYDPLSRLSHLSRLQQAVVYAELLGPPKSLREDI
ncbi:MAG: hypothetical protein LDL24_04155 [Treponema sp.]|nr:hypothetical protein [Treponema sp.]